MTCLGQVWVIWRSNSFHVANKDAAKLDGSTDSIYPPNEIWTAYIAPYQREVVDAAQVVSNRNLPAVEYVSIRQGVFRDNYAGAAGVPYDGGNPGSVNGACGKILLGGRLKKTETNLLNVLRTLSSP